MTLTRDRDKRRSRVEATGLQNQRWRTIYAVEQNHYQEFP